MDRDFNIDHYGMSVHIDLIDCNADIIRDADKILNWVKELCDKIKMVCYGAPKIYHFGHGSEKTLGYSIIQLIETSNITAHFAESSNSAYIDIFSCKYFNYLEALSFCEDYFIGVVKDFNVLIRGKYINSEVEKQPA